MNTGRVVFIVFERIRNFSGHTSDYIKHVCDSEEAAFKRVKNYICPYPDMKETEPGLGYERTFKDHSGYFVSLYILQREVES
jgi:hypothetical protein